MDPLTIAMLASTLLKAKSDSDQSARDRQVTAATQRYSPWTHMQAGPATSANTFGTLAGGAASAAAMQQNANRSQQPEAKPSILDAAVNPNEPSGGPQGDPRLQVNATEFPGLQPSYADSERARLAQEYNPNTAWGMVRR